MHPSEPIEWQWDKGPIGRLVKTGYITLRREVEELLHPLGLTHTQWSALGVIRQYPGISPSQLEPILMIERPSVTSLLKGLTNKGLIRYKDHPQDGRSKLIFLTEAGSQLAEETQHFTSVVEERVKAEMTAEEFDTLKSLLTKMIRTFEKQ
ncbi:MarR family winged helix-turn-helix transcriptional regulator [Paenibacillus sp. MB22_1]|uniref:MarR family winged helix-turn-helix transcriptional regulator n=1 Tax=Paenibacillus TaxID=44249 RepID=UPI0001AFD30D|nr:MULTISPECIES: MarR family transcriptional regulator [unclassified Paenibacillus]EES73487.1 transcriptional regulator, MarR family [Paenibacillus sp. oral taxon 786 str. D14]MCT2195287.1 MarR family transcriptional regulator [Paenibacillus sp. p3-SID1389]